jgi:hypothetical protein
MTMTASTEAAERPLARLVADISDFANREGSTRAVALVRILILLLVLVKWGEDLAFFSARAPGAIYLSPLFFIAAGAALVGWRTKPALFALTILLAVYYFGYGQKFGVNEWAHHHSYMLLFVVAMLNGAPCEKSYSVDRWLAVRRAARRGEQAPVERGPLWAQSLIILQLAALYFWTAIDKTEWQFLNGERLERIFEWAYAGHPAYALLTQGWFLAASSTAVVVIEFFLAYALLAGRFKRAAFAIALVLHIGFYFFLKVDTYSATMLVLYLLYANPERVHRAIDELQGYGAKGSASA